MNPKIEWLSRAKDIQLEIRQLQEVRRRAFDQLTRVTPSMSGMPGGGSTDEHKTDRLVILDSLIEEQKQKLAESYEEILRAIETVPSATGRTILKDLYIMGKSWEQIGRHVHYSPRQCQRLHGKALMAIKIPGLQ